MFNQLVFAKLGLTEMNLLICSQSEKPREVENSTTD